MADTHVNFVKQTVSGTPGTGTITLAGAVAKFRAMASTLDGIALDGDTFSLSLEDGNNRSFETGCLYNSTAGTFARGTVESSTTGARLSLTSAAIVSVSLPASRGTAWDGGFIPVDNTIAEGASTPNPGYLALRYSETLARLMAYLAGAWRVLALINQTNTWFGAQRGSITTLTDGATVTPDFAANNFFTLTLGGNRTLANPTNLVAGQSGSIFIVQDGTGSRLISSWGSNWDFAGGTLPTLSTAANAVDRLDYLVRTTGSIHASLAKDVK